MADFEQPADAAKALVGRIHAAEVRFVLAVTGGGSGAIASLLAVPGGSRTVLEALVPYAPEALQAFLKSQPEQFCSELTARLIATAAFERARRYAGDAQPPAAGLAGIGCTASLVSDRPKRGAHRIHVAAQTADLTAVASLELTKGARTRKQEEAIAARLILNVIARACRLPDRLPVELQAEEALIESATTPLPAWRRLWLGETNVALGGGISETGADEARRSPRVIFPGAFHPLHDGHREMARIAADRTGSCVEWEISITNVDKPLLDYREMLLRVEQFPTDEPVWFTRAPTFVEKSAIFPGAVFIVGADTITRIADHRYYGDDAKACEQALAAIAGAGCRFLVFGRSKEGCFESLADLRLPTALRSICDEVPPSTFRADVSSTALRQAAHAAD